MNACIACQKTVPNNVLSKCGKCANHLYCSRECQVSHWDLHKPTCNTQFVMRPSTLISGVAGMGLLATTTNIKRGTLLFQDVPILKVPKTQAARSQTEAEHLHQQAIQQGFEKLHAKKKRAFLDLSCWDKYYKNEDIQSSQHHNVQSTAAAAASSVFGKFQTNSFQIDDESSALFLGFCRMNHACRPNVHHVWRVDLQKLEMRALRDISKGEELLIHYGPSECLDTKGRRAHLQTEFGFICSCAMCAADDSDSNSDSADADSSSDGDKKGDARMREINTRTSQIQTLVQTQDYQKALDSITICLQLMQDQDIHQGMLVRPLYTMAYQVCLHGIHDRTKARDYLDKELQLRELYEGSDSPGAKECRRLRKQLLR